jgi:hypothetical protein
VCFSLWYLHYHPADSYHQHSPTADLLPEIAVQVFVRNMKLQVLNKQEENTIITFQKEKS